MRWPFARRSTVDRLSRSVQIQESEINGMVLKIKWLESELKRERREFCSDVVRWATTAAHRENKAGHPELFDVFGGEKCT